MRYRGPAVVLAISIHCFSLELTPLTPVWADDPVSAKETAASVAPASAPDNSGGWVLNQDISDEFDGDQIDHDKWFVQGLNGDYYIWKGRAPSQFFPHNAVVEDGKLKIRTRWEPGFKFAGESYADGPHDDAYGKWEGKELPVTTAGVVSKKRFLYGYMEVKSKAGDACMTSAFWAIGHQQELDIFEQMGNPKITGSISESISKTTVHDWSPPATRPTRVFGYPDHLPTRVADGFHIYGAEWGEDYLKIYRDGVLKYEVHQSNIGTDWVLNNPMEIWLDSEIFTWYGVPHQAELPVDFEIEYVRIWQKPSTNLLAEHRAFFGFEGPILFQDQPRPLEMKPEDVEDNDYQKFWVIDETSARHFRIVENRWATGVNCLKYVSLKDKVDIKATTPEGAIDLPTGEYELSFSIFLNHGGQPEKLYVKLKSPEVVIKPFELTNAERGSWITMAARFTKDSPSSEQDQLELSILGEEIPKGAVDFYLDDISITAVR